MKRLYSALLSVALCLCLSVPVLGAEGQATVFSDPTAFTDATQITYWNAVAALTKLRVVTGKEDGAFHPADTLTRAEAAKLITAILCGGSEPATWEYTDASFSDTKGHWAENYIECCASLGIISGRGDGRFDPDSEVTTQELVKMALGALGYDADEYALLGETWVERTDALARFTEPSLYTGLSSVVLTRSVTRDDTAQILYNALCATPKVAVAQYTDSNGQKRWTIEDATKSDGSPASLLYQKFELDEIGDLPAQPVK